MRVDEAIRKNVVFVGEETRGQFTPRGTGFWASTPAKNKQGSYYFYIVTAQHVIEKIHEIGNKKILIRYNTNTGEAVTSSFDVGNWYFHPDRSFVRTDVAVLPVSLDTRKVAWTAADPSVFLSEEDLKAENDFGVGDEVVIVGLFSRHYGGETNIPIVRIGNLAAIPEEPIRTKYCGRMDGYLVEARSIGGLSGSPVWLYHPPTRVKDGQLQIAKGNRMRLLGLMHGHFDLQDLTDDTTIKDTRERAAGIHAGIGIVVPAFRILETINHPELTGQRK